MPVQTTQSTLAQRFGGRIAAANAEHKDKPLDTGFKRLPPGIRDGVGKLQTVAMKQYTNDEKITALRGQEYLYVVGVVKHPKSHNNDTTEGHQMFLRFPLCDVPANPANPNSKATSFSDNWYEFQQFFMRFKINPPQETAQTDPQGTRTWAYYQSAIQALAGKLPHYRFTTRSWTPPATTAKPKPEPLIFEDWGEQCEWTGQHNPAAGVTENPTAYQPAPFTEPPQGGTVYQSNGQETLTPPTQPIPGTSLDPADHVAALVEVAMNDPDGATEDGANASAQLEELAWAAGWTKEQTAPAADWAAVGDMALNPPAVGTGATTTQQPPNSTPPPAGTVPTVGGKVKYAKRTRDGLQLANAKGEPFPAQECEVVAVDASAKTCILKSAKDGKLIVDIKTKQPVAVKFEWLE